MRYFQILILSLIALFLFNSCSTNNKNCLSYKMEYLKGKYFFNNRKDSLEFLNKLSKKNMKLNCFNIYIIEGVFHYYLSNDSLAKIKFLKAYSLNPNNIIGNYYLANLYSLNGKHDSALHFINIAVNEKNNNGSYREINPLFNQEFDISYKDLVYQKGEILFQIGKYNLAKNHFTFLVNDDNYKLKSAEFLSDIYYELGKTDSSLYFKNIK